MEWSIKSFGELGGADIYRILQARVQVFMLEQACLYPELDGKDMACYHLLAQKDSMVTAYCRLVPPGVSYPQASIGRVLVHPDYRGQGLAQELMSRALAFLTEEWNEAGVQIQAQQYLRHFYGSFGFQAVSDVYLDDGIPHVDMILGSGHSDRRSGPRPLPGPHGLQAGK